MDGDEMRGKSFPDEWSSEFYKKNKLLTNTAVDCTKWQA
jgi:hypothetical protein